MPDKRDSISQRASQLAASNPPGVVLENLLLWMFRAIGLVLGRGWFYGSKVVYFIGLAFMDGYVHGAHAVRQPAPQQLPAPVSPPIVDDDRIADHTTPFGVPFGPNVHASHD
jgi:hypothetical protein